MLFWMTVALAVLTLLLLFFIVPKADHPTGGKVDFVGAAGLALGLVGVLLAVSQGNTWGWASASTLGSAIAGLLILGIWGWYELRAGNPLVDLRVAVRPAVLTTNLASVAMGFALFSSNVAFPQLLQLPEQVGGLGIALLPASVALMPSGLAMLAMSPISGRIESKIGPKPLLVSGAIVIAAAYLASVLVPFGVLSIIIVNGVIGIGIGLGYAAMPALIMSAVPASETGSANGLNTLMRSFGTTTASAVVGAILAASAGTNVTDSFTIVFILGLAAAALCALIGFFIPQARRGKELEQLS